MSNKITQKEMKEYGYTKKEMRPVSKKEATNLFLFMNKDIFKLYPDGSEAVVQSLEEIGKFDGMFGVKIPKYTMIVTSEDERYGVEKNLSFYGENPWEGNLETIVSGNTAEELYNAGDFEGLFYQLYSSETSKRIGYGTIDAEYPKTDIEEFEKREEDACMMEKEKIGKLIILTGFSAAGKTAIANGLLEISDRYVNSVSATTRPPRPGEKEGIDYYFLSKEQFEQMLVEGKFLETAEYCGEKYGTPFVPIVKKLNEGRDVILVLEYTGAKYVQETFPSAITFFIAAPAEELKKRLSGRERGESELSKRLSVTVKEATYIPQFDYLIINSNGKLQKSIDLIHGIITGQKYLTSKNLDLVERLRKDLEDLT